MKLSDKILELYDKGYDEDQIKEYCLKQGTSEEHFQNSLRIAEQKYEARGSVVTPKENNVANIINPVAQPYTTQSENTNINNPYKSPKSRMVSIRLPLEMFELIKDDPSGKVKFAIKCAYNKTPVQ